MVMTYSSSLFRNSSLALPSRIADSEFPEKAEVEAFTLGRFVWK